jgi:DNA uptake protein ComE-like DNA-binding protein
MHTTLWSGNNKGYVLVIVLGLLAALGVMALSLGAAARADLAQTRRFQDETAAELLAKAGIDWTIHYLNTVERQGTLWQAPWTSQVALFQGRPLGAGTFDVQYTDPDGALHYGLQDEEARVNLNVAPVALLAALPGVGTELAETIIKQRQQRSWVAPEELLHHGLVSPSVWYGSGGQAGLNAYLTVWGSGKININTAPLVVMAAVPGMTPALLEAIIRHRQGDDQQLGTSDDRYFRAVTDLATVTGVDGGGLERAGAFLTVTPSAFRFIATGRVPRGTSQARTHLRLAVIERTAQATALRYWRRLD